MKTKSNENIVPIRMEGFGTVEEKTEIDRYYKTHRVTKGYDLVNIVLTELRRRLHNDHGTSSQAGVANSAGMQEEKTS